MTCMVFFKKFDPNVRLNTSRGYTVPFAEVGDGWGVLATEDAYLIGELRKAQAEQRGGVMEIEATEFEELKKKESPSQRVWREVVGHLQLRRLYRGAQGSAAAAGRQLPFVPTGFSENKALARPMAKSTFIPKSVAR